MRRKQLALAAATVAGVLALSACGGSDAASPGAEPPPATTTAPDTTGPGTTTEETTTEKTTTEQDTTEDTTTGETSTGETTPERPPGPEAVVIRVENGEPVGGVETVEVTQGDKVVIRVQVDAPQELHLHGYEIEKEAAPGRPAVFRFTADLEGIFDLESHAADTKLVKLIVNP